LAVTDTARRALRSAETPAAGAGTASPVYFLLHMPRTGGNTITAHLKAHLGDQVCAVSRPAPLQVLGRQRFNLDEGPDFRRVHAVTGHYLGRSLERRFPGREIRRTLLLRDPIGFHVSYYNHRMMFSLSRGGPTCDFERHLRAQPADLVPLLLLWYWLEMPLRTFLATGDSYKFERLNESLAGFWFIGGYEDGDRLLAAIAADLGIPAATQRKNTTSEWRKRVPWRPLRAEELSSAMRDAILAKNPLHDALWHGWRGAGFAVAQHASRNGSFPLPVIPGSSPGRAGSGWGLRGAGGLGLRDLVCAVMADQFIAPIWRRIGRASRAGDWPRAARLYRKALRRVPDAPAIWVQYGHALKETGDVAGAEIAYRRAIALAPDAAEWHLFLGEALLRQGRTEEARAALLRCEQLDPAALRQQQLELASRGNPAEAIAAYWRALTGGGVSS
jgi:tetratricopeptide (TPR) repeat protein